MNFKHPELILAIIPVAIALFVIIRLNFVKFDDFRDQAGFEKSRKLRRLLIFFSRIAIFSLLIIALAEPFDLRQETVPGSPSLTIFVDKSESFGMYNQNISDEIASKIEAEIPVNIKTISEGNRSAIGDGILANMQGDDSILLITDGNNNYGRSLGDMMLFASSLNSTISALDLSPIYSDAYVTIEGPSETTADVENTFKVKTRETGKVNPYMLTVLIDGRKELERSIDGSKEITFTKTLSEGYHQLTAQTDSKDHFPENNKFMKSVKVQPKPKILFLAQKTSPAMPIFNNIYDVTVSNTMPYDMKKYSAIVLDDIKASSLPMESLTNYVLDGNGIFIIGGKNSFDKDNYKDASYKPYEALMPVVVGTGKEEPKRDVNVVIVVDISGSTGNQFSKSSENEVSDVEKALAISILKDLKKTDYVGAIAFETYPHKVSDLRRLSDNPELENKIGSLAYGGGTDIAAGLQAAGELFKDAHGSKSIILISDGLTGGNPGDDIRMASFESSSGIKVYTVGVGERTDVKHMQDIATAGNGMFFQPKETERIKLILGESEKANDSYRLETVNNYHFITRNIELKATVSGYNFVLPKSQAQLLVTTTENIPIMTAWRFGLGRIVVLSTDDGTGWNGQMLGKENSAIITKATNWAIGDLSRNKDFDVKMDDINLGEELQINVISSKMPTSPNLNFTKTGERLYTATYTPEEPGYYKFFDAVVAVNYNKELSQTGMNPELDQLVSTTNGTMFKPEDTAGIIQKVKQDSKRVKTESNSYAWLLAIAAIILFLIEIAIRRIAEAKRINKQQG